MSGEPPFTETDLHRAADGRLDVECEAAFARHLAANPADAERVSFYRRLNDELHRLYDPLLTESLPLAWTERPRGARWMTVGRLAAAACVAIAFGAGWFGRDLLIPPSTPAAGATLAHEAVLAHAVYSVEVRHPVEVPGDQEQHLEQWLSKRLGGRVEAPRLSAIDYQLVGGRLLPGDSGPAAQLMYENGAGTRVTLYIRSGIADSDTAFRFSQENGTSVFYWRDQSFGYALTGEMSREALLAICNAVYAQINPTGNAAGW